MNDVTLVANCVTTDKITGRHLYSDNAVTFIKVVMNRRNFIAITGATIAVAGGIYYLSTDKSNFVRADTIDDSSGGIPFKDDERAILYLASLAPSGHNT